MKKIKPGVPALSAVSEQEFDEFQTVMHNVLWDEDLSEHAESVRQKFISRLVATAEDFLTNGYYDEYVEAALPRDTLVEFKTRSQDISVGAFKKNASKNLGISIAYMESTNNNADMDQIKKSYAHTALAIVRNCLGQDNCLQHYNAFLQIINDEKPSLLDPLSDEVYDNLIGVSRNELMADNDDVAVSHEAGVELKL